MSTIKHTPGLKASGIGNRLRQFVSNLSLDVWGIERKVNENVLGYFESAAKKYGLNAEGMYVAFDHEGARLRMCLCREDSILQQIKTTELLDFFGASALIPEKLEKQVREYLIYLSQRYQIPVASVVVTVSCENKKAVVKLHRDADPQAVIPVSELLDFFLPSRATKLIT